MLIPADDHFNRLADGIHEDLYEPWREIDAWITSFCPCSLTLSGACSPKQRSRTKRSQSRSCHRSIRGKASDPDGSSPNITALRRASPCR